MGGEPRDGAFRRFWNFFLGSGLGLTIDLVGFYALVVLSVEPGVANLISSFVSITAVYFFVTRYSFRTTRRASTYVLFVVWYSTSIVCFSLLIQFATDLSGWTPFVWKACSIPLSFTANYAFSRYLFRR